MAIRRNTVLIAAVILLTALFFVIPALFNVDRYRGQVISYLHLKTGKQFEIARLALTFFPLSIRVDNLGVKNSPLFPPGSVGKVALTPTGLDAPGLLPPALFA